MTFRWLKQSALASRYNDDGPIFHRYFIKKVSAINLTGGATVGRIVRVHRPRPVAMPILIGFTGLSNTGGRAMKLDTVSQKLP